MEPQEEEAVGTKGPFEVKIVNGCARTIKDVRVTHYLKDDSNTEVCIIPSMAVDGSVKNTFVSHNGKNDIWTVAFQIETAAGDQIGYMAKKLDKSKSKGRSDYQLVISETNLKFQFMENGFLDHAQSDVGSVWECVVRS
jgi:hypothetical protein